MHCPHLCLYRSLALTHLSSFPTRRSSDLSGIATAFLVAAFSSSTMGFQMRSSTIHWPGSARSQASGWCSTASGSPSSKRRRRSEEHTSELQSHSDLVCRLLLEKKKKKNTN